MRPKSRSVEEQVAQIARGQHGLVTTSQLLASGLTRAAIKRRVQKALLHRVHQGVYRLGHRAPSLEAMYLAAVLAGGEDAVLSGQDSWNTAAMRGGIPITMVPRTIVDVASSYDVDALGRLCHDAEVRYGMTAASVKSALERRGKGAAWESCARSSMARRGSR